MYVSLNCEYCDKKFGRPKGNYDEAVRLGWKQFCSLECQKLSKQRIVVGVCKTCGVEIIRQKSKVESLEKIFCSHTCSARYTNRHRVTKLMIARENRKNTKPICINPNCSKQIGIDNKQFCSPQCRYEACKILDEKYVTKNIDDFVKKNGRIPLKQEFVSLYSRARLAFGTWNKAIIAAGFNPNPVRFANHFVAKDGHPCDSLSEKIVDDWLSTHKIPHEVKVKYPWNNGMSADFKIGEYYVEFFGLVGQLKNYDRLMKIKLQKIKEYNLKLISIYLSDIFPKNKLESKLVIANITRRV